MSSLVLLLLLFSFLLYRIPHGQYAQFNEVAIRDTMTRLVRKKKERNEMKFNILMKAATMRYMAKSVLIRRWKDPW